MYYLNYRLINEVFSTGACIYSLLLSLESRKENLSSIQIMFYQNKE